VQIIMENETHHHRGKNPQGDFPGPGISNFFLLTEFRHDRFLGKLFSE
jgi:hypothetical protein